MLLTVFDVNMGYVKASWEIMCQHAASIISTYFLLFCWDGVYFLYLYCIYIYVYANFFNYKLLLKYVLQHDHTTKQAKTKKKKTILHASSVITIIKLFQVFIQFIYL